MTQAGMAVDPRFVDWIGRTNFASDVVTAGLVQGFLATLDHEPVAAVTGAAAPQGIHWLCAAPRPRASDLGPDGHAARGLLLPPVELPHRMWAGSKVEFLHPIHVGDVVECQSTVRAITGKTGSSGPLVFVEIDHLTRAGGRDAVRERQTIVYRGLGNARRPAATSGDKPGARLFSRRIVPDPVLLFRYSALTFNAHRIHYDRPYATEVEGYPDLVVHGPLIATLLIDLATRHYGPNALESFVFRGVSPAFSGEPLILDAFSNGSRLDLQASASDGRKVIVAEATLVSTIAQRGKGP